jgi:hypothetical protein
LLEGHFEGETERVSLPTGHGGVTVVEHDFREHPHVSISFPKVSIDYVHELIRPLPSLIFLPPYPLFFLTRSIAQTADTGVTPETVKRDEEFAKAEAEAKVKAAQLEKEAEEKAAEVKEEASKAAAKAEKKAGEVKEVVKDKAAEAKKDIEKKSKEAKAWAKKEGKELKKEAKSVSLVARSSGRSLLTGLCKGTCPEEGRC